MIFSKKDTDSAEKTAEMLKSGKIIITPTDTVYGFSGIVDMKGFEKRFKTDDRIRAIKGRSETKPLIQLIAQPEQIKLYTDDEIPQNVLEKWPGALTVIVRIKKDSPLADFAETVAFRCPGDPWLRKVISLCNAPVYSTSVNRSGSPVLDEIKAIINEFENETDLIIDDGDKKGALPSTLISIADGKINVLRQGCVRI